MRPFRPTRLAVTVAFALPLAMAMPGVPSAWAQSPDTATVERDSGRPYDAELFQLAEVLGAIHYLRALCGADEGQKWRDQMRSLVDAEGNTALRRARLVRSFNRGYRGYGRTYQRCTELARLSIARLMKEGRALAKRMLDAAG